MARDRIIESWVPKLLSSLYGINDCRVERNPGGRLSDTFKIFLPGQPNLFFKISRQEEPNTPFSTKVTEEGRNLGFPFPRTHPGRDGQLFQTVPDSINGEEVPDFLKKMTTTLVDLHPMPEPLSDTHTLGKFHAMGQYLGEYNKFNRFADTHPDIPSDPLSPAGILALIQKTYGITSNMLHEEINARAKTLADNLTSQDPITQGFKAGLHDGILPYLLLQLHTLTTIDAEIASPLPQGLINNEVKLNNLFFALDKITQKPTISLAFDLDMASKGPLVKDLGRTIALSCFDRDSGELQVDKMLALIQGRHEVNPLTAKEIEALGHYIELGICASFALRSSYFAELLQGQPAAYEVDRLNPAVHVRELNSFREWAATHNFHDIIAQFNLPQREESMPKPYLVTEKPEMPARPEVIKLSPGPIPSKQASPKDSQAYRVYCSKTFGISTEVTLAEELDGRVHRSELAMDVFRNMITLARDVCVAPNLAHTTHVFSTEGGHHAANICHANFFTTQKNVPVVTIANGAFSGEWTKSLVEEYGNKGFLDRVIPVTIPDGQTPTAQQIQKALQAAGINEGQPFNLQLTVLETSTGAQVPKEELAKILTLPGLNTVIMDTSSALMSTSIPGITTSEGIDPNVKVVAFATSQKGLQGPTDHTLVFMSDSLLPLLGKPTTVPMPKDIKIDPNELDAYILKRSTNPKTAAELHRSLWLMQQEKAQEQDPITIAHERSSFVESAVKERPQFEFFVKDQKSRSTYNTVLYFKGPPLDQLPADKRQLVLEQAHRILEKENLAYDIKPYGDRGDFRFTTTLIQSKEEADKILDAITYAVKMAIYIMERKVIDLVAEDQFLYSTPEEVDRAIISEQKKLAALGITFIDARPGKPGAYIEEEIAAQNARQPNAKIAKDIATRMRKKYYSDLPDGRYVIYKPQLTGSQITDEYNAMTAATVQPTSIIVAAKTVPPEARFDTFIRQGAGTNNMPKTQAQQDGHVVENCPGVNSKVTSNNTLNALAGHPHVINFATQCHSGEASALNLRPLYGPSPDIDIDRLNATVNGKVVTVLGAGDIGSETVKELLRSRAAQVRVYSRSLVGAFTQEQLGQLQAQYPKLFIYNSLEQAILGADVLVNHLALVPGETENLVQEHHLRSMAPNATIIDAARPGIIDPDALIKAHQAGHITRVVVDFDTPDKDPKNQAIGQLFSYATSKGVNPGFLYSPHAFADTCPTTREIMLDRALFQAQEAREGRVHNFAGLGDIPQGFVDLGKNKPEGISSLRDYLLRGLEKQGTTVATSAAADDNPLRATSQFRVNEHTVA